MQKITPNIWFNRNAAEAVRSYTELFPDSRITSATYYGKEGYEFHQMPEGTVMTMEFELYGEQFVALNGGAQFPLSPAISFMVMCDTEEELDRVWAGLSEGGSVVMALGAYDWSPKYGWINDRYGVSWQLYLGEEAHTGQKIVPTLLFAGAQCGKAEEAIRLYTTIFEDSETDGILHYTAGDDDREGLVKHGQFRVRDYTLMAMDSSASYDFGFNESISLIVHCRTQAEVDHYWDRLREDGGQESQCGWLKDRFGISWQIVPLRLYELMTQKDKTKAAKVTAAMLQMKKLDIALLEAAGG